MTYFELYTTKEILCKAMYDNGDTVKSLSKELGINSVEFSNWLNGKRLVLAKSYKGNRILHQIAKKYEIEFADLYGLCTSEVAHMLPSMSTIMPALHTKIGRKRLSKNLKQSEFAKSIGMCYGTYSLIERGLYSKIMDPTSEKVLAIAKALDLDPDTVADESHKNNPDATPYTDANPYRDGVCSVLLSAC